MPAAAFRATEADIAVASRRAKELGAEYGKKLKVFAMYTIVPDATDAAVEARWPATSRGLIPLPSPTWLQATAASRTARKGLGVPPGTLS